MNSKNNLPIDIETFGFVEREKVNGKTLTNQCGRDFLYYCLHYYLPQKHNPTQGNPQQIRESRIFGYKVPSLLAGTGLGFIKIPQYLRLIM